MSRAWNYYPLLLFHVAVKGNGNRNIGRIKEDYKALAAHVKNTSALVNFSKW